MSKKQLSSFIFTPDNESIPNEINPNESEEVKFSFSNFSTHFDEHINKSIRGYSDLRNDVVKISEYFVENDTTVMDLGSWLWPKLMGDRSKIFRRVVFE